MEGVEFATSGGDLLLLEQQQKASMLVISIRRGGEAVVSDIISMHGLNVHEIVVATHVNI